MKTWKRQKLQVKGKKAKGKRKKVRVTRREVPEPPQEDQYDPWPELQPGYQGPVRPRPRVPPPESEVWPPEYRGERWKRIYATLFAGKCLLCQYSFPQPHSRQMRDRWLRQDTPLLCTNHAACPGALIEVLRTEACRNFKAKYWRPARAERTEPERWPPKRRKGVRRVPLSRGLFATVDAADYKEIRKHKWSASCRGKKVYACAWINGRSVLMHRFLMRPRKGYVVDHIDGNGLNNCRSNLRACTPGQNQTNYRSLRGFSRFVGVRRRGDRWEAWIRHNGNWMTLGLYDDEVEAARARDRKAVALHGPYAYLNFPEDWRFDKHGVGHPVRPTPRRRRQRAEDRRQRTEDRGRRTANT